MKKTLLLPTLFTAALLFNLGSVLAAEAPKPLKVLLITGGCCHDYGKQKDILKAGIEARIHAVVDQVHTDDKSTKPPLAIYGNPEYAKGYDVVIHDECSADVRDEAVIQGVLKPHKDGIPGVNLHCAMHSYRIGNPGEATTALGTPHSFWFEYLGLQSSGHGPQEPIDITYVAKESPITKGLADWTTIKEELYNNVKIFEGTETLAKGRQVTRHKKKQADGTEKTSEREENAVIAWTNLYNGKTRV
ncbi:MAG: ThuA domain-containing protein, partial [Verrucomicrobiota bacterium]